MSVYVKKDNKGVKKSDTATDKRICNFLHQILDDKYSFNKILDPCCGDRRLTELFDCDVINYEIKEGKDFLKETNKIDCDLVIMNPPFNLGGSGRKLSVEVFMDKVLSLVDNQIPIILITPMGFRLNQRIKSKRWKKIRDTYPPITSIISLPLDIFENTLFHCEILCFNCNELNPHYFLDI
tara:strand:- start:4200 stop:4742 length:543 start_codon:yes stop_codon:yes gene_type:complete